MRFTAALLDRTATAWEEEYDRWIYRRRLDKRGYEAVRLEADVIAERFMKITQLGTSDAIAEPAFKSMRRRACAKAALLVAPSRS